jgi:hypothetical protein
MGNSNNTIGSLNLDTSSEGSVRRSSNLTGGQKFADALQEGVGAVGDIADNLANVFPHSGGAVLSAVASGLSGVTGGGGPFGGSGPGAMGGVLGGGGGFAGAMGGGGDSGGLNNMSSIQGPMGRIALPSKLTPLQMLKLQQQLQNQSQLITMISSIINMEHQTAMSIIQNIH